MEPWKCKGCGETCYPDKMHKCVLSADTVEDVVSEKMEEIHGYFYGDIDKDDLWHELLPSYQRELAVWLYEELKVRLPSRYDKSEHLA